MRIIGIELRLRTYVRLGNEQKEIAIVPCHVDVELDSKIWQYVSGVFMNATLHTDCGDIAIPDFQVPDYFLMHRDSAIKEKQTL